jgi:hypothetical protein
MKTLIKITIALLTDVVYDLQAALAAGQTTLTNPTGVFTFGQYSHGELKPENFVPYANFTENMVGTGLNCFYNDAYNPNVTYNSTDATVNAFKVAQQAGEFVFGPMYGPSVVRFTAPAAGKYRISAKFVQVQFDESEHDAPTAYVYHNSTQLDSGLADASGFTYSGALSLLKGDTIDFLVGGPDSGTANASLATTLAVVP